MSKHFEMVVQLDNGKTERTRIDDPRELQQRVNRTRTRADVVDVDVETVKTPRKGPRTGPAWPAERLMSRNLDSKDQDWRSS